MLIKLTMLLIFFAVMVAIGITADEIEDFGKFLLVDFSPFQNSAT